MSLCFPHFALLSFFPRPSLCTLWIVTFVKTVIGERGERGLVGDPGASGIPGKAGEAGLCAVLCVFRL